jgi:hypothetical protein
MTEELEVIEEQERAPARSLVIDATPMGMLARAVADGADIEKLEKLMALAERWEANEARKAYAEAMAKFKKNPPEIFKDKEVGFESRRTGGKTSYMHATIGNVVEKIVEGLAKHGFSHSWLPVQTGRRIKVTCILTHSRGHSTETPLEGDADESGQKNPLQAVASTVTYLERYTLLAATGLATKDQLDGDGRRGEREDSGDIGDVHEPGQRPEEKPQPLQPWQELTPDGWKDCGMPGGGCYGDLLAIPDGNKVLFKAWAAYRSAPPLLAWAAGWIWQTMPALGINWPELRQAPRLAQSNLPEDFYELKAGQLWAVATEVRMRQVEAAEKGGAK